MNASLMSRMWTSGRQGVPSLLMKTRPVVTAQPTRLFTTRSPRRRGETPYAVALRMYTGQKSGPASLRRSSSTKTFDRPYAVTGLNAAVSSRTSLGSAAPYTLHDDE